jgi:hypothetical protein
LINVASGDWALGGNVFRAAAEIVISAGGAIPADTLGTALGVSCIGAISKETDAVLFNCGPLVVNFEVCSSVSNDLDLDVGHVGYGVLTAWEIDLALNFLIPRFLNGGLGGDGSGFNLLLESHEDLFPSFSNFFVGLNVNLFTALGTFLTSLQEFWVLTSNFSHSVFSNNFGMLSKKWGVDL